MIINHELRVASCNLKAQKHELKSKRASSNPRVQIHELPFQIHGLRVQIHELKVQIDELQVQIHKLWDQFHKLRVQIQNFLINENSSKQR